MTTMTVPTLIVALLVAAMRVDPAIAFLSSRVSTNPSASAGSTTTTTTTTTTTSLLRATDFNNNVDDTSSPLLSARDYETIANGRIAVVPDFLPLTEVQQLRGDAQATLSRFTTDALASYGTSGNFDPSKDRAVLKLRQWQDESLGDYALRRRFGARMAALRAELSTALHRPRLVEGLATSRYGYGSTEISYTRFGPGAFLARHVDEHHEELKGRAGWSQPTRRSLSWLIYLNEDWNAVRDGGQLRCYQRPTIPAASSPIGARPNGDLQVAWLRATVTDPVERPVYLAAPPHNNNNNNNNNNNQCAMYIVLDETTQRPTYITDDFDAHPILYVAGSEYLAQKLLVRSPALAARFHLIEPPNSKLKRFQKPADDEVLLDVEPRAGTLVVFDSVALPHEVLATKTRDRWATSGWFHEDQQPIA